MFTSSVCLYSMSIVCRSVCVLVDLDMAIAYWNIVLHDKFKFLDLWSRYLVVSMDFNIAVPASLRLNLLSHFYDIIVHC